MRNTALVEQRTKPAHALLMREAFDLAFLQVANGASAPAASAGGSAVVKMKPEAKERMKSQSAADPVM